MLYCRGILYCWVAVLFSSIPAVDAAMHSKQHLKTTNGALEEASRAVVLIISTNADYHLIKYSESANGIIISKDGYILTVSHALNGSLPEVYVGNERYPAKVVYNDRKYDIAILKIDVPFDLSCVKFAGDNSIRQEVYLVGKRKRNRELFMSRGILNVKGINMSSKEISWVKTNINEKKKVDYAVQNGILHSAHFFVGLSGCPLLNTNGEVIGMNTGLIGRAEQRITLALELVCFLPIIEQVTRSQLFTADHLPCDLNIDLKNPVERVAWVMNGLYYYCSLLGKDSNRLDMLRIKIEAAAKKKIVEEGVPPKEAILWAWKSFLTESYKMR